MKRKPVDESKLVKMYYIERRVFQPEVYFAILYGTVGKVDFMVKRREYIVGDTYDTRISLDSSSLFREFTTAAQAFKEASYKSKDRLKESAAKLDEGISKVNELIALVVRGVE